MSGLWNPPGRRSLLAPKARSPGTGGEDEEQQIEVDHRETSLLRRPLRPSFWGRYHSLHVAAKAAGTEDNEKNSVKGTKARARGGLPDQIRGQVWAIVSLREKKTRH